MSPRQPTASDRQGFDRRWFAPNIERVYAPRDGDGVRQAWQEAIDAGAGPGEIQITSGRHCYEGFVYNPRTRFVIDTTGLLDVVIHPDLGHGIGSGFDNWGMYRVFQNLYGRTLPAGSCYSVGLGGHITGGGYGLLSRLHGLTVDHLTGVDMVVCRDGRPEILESVSAANAPDLFWAVRGGGGGNFGVITRYYFGTPPLSPNKMYTAAFTIDWTDIADAQQFGDILNGFADLFAGPANSEHRNLFAEVHANHVDAGSISVLAFAYDDPVLGLAGSECDALVAERINDLGRRLAEAARLSSKPGRLAAAHRPYDTRLLAPAGTQATYRQYTYLSGTQNLDGSGPNQFGKYKSAYMNEPFTSTMVEALYAGLNERLEPWDFSSSLVQIDSYGGAINDAASDATPIPQRSSILKLQYQSYWDNDCAVGEDNPAQQAAHVDWLNRMYTATYADYGGFPDPKRNPPGRDEVDGAYFNYPDVFLGTNDAQGPENPGIEFALDLYFKGNWRQKDLPFDPANPATYNLQDIKRRWNPSDWFRSAQSVPV